MKLKGEGVMWQSPQSHFLANEKTKPTYIITILSYVYYLYMMTLFVDSRVKPGSGVGRAGVAERVDACESGGRLVNIVCPSATFIT